MLVIVKLVARDGNKKLLTKISEGLINWVIIELKQENYLLEFTFSNIQKKDLLKLANRKITEVSAIQNWQNTLINEIRRY